MSGLTFKGEAALTHKDAPKPLRRAAKALFRLDWETGQVNVSSWGRLSIWEKDSYVQKADAAVAAYANGTRKTFERQLREKSMEGAVNVLVPLAGIEDILSGFNDAASMPVGSDREAQCFDAGYSSAVDGMTRRIRDLLKQ